MIRVLIADDQPAVRRALRVLLEASPGISVVAQAASGPEAVRMAHLTRPHVALMDVRMPGGDGLAATRELTSADVGTAVIVMTTFDLDDYLFGALEAGASGFLLKDAQPAELLAAVRAAAGGEALVSARVTRRVIAEFARRRPGAGPAKRDTAPPEPLTHRELEVLTAMSEGLSNSELAERLGIEIGTVKTHVSNLIAKLGVRDRVQAIVWAFTHGLTATTVKEETR